MSDDTKKQPDFTPEQERIIGERIAKAVGMASGGAVPRDFTSAAILGAPEPKRLNNDAPNVRLTVCGSRNEHVINGITIGREGKVFATRDLKWRDDVEWLGAHRDPFVVVEFLDENGNLMFHPDKQYGTGA